jgi:putative transcriptional regulator
MIMRKRNSKIREKIVRARLTPDGRVVRVLSDGTEEPTPVEPIQHWSDARIEAAARSDPDNPPLTKAQLAKMRRVPRVKTLRWALGLSEEEFASRFQIPLGTLRDREQGRTEPDQAARAYLDVIAHNPQHVRDALRATKKPRRSQTKLASK